MSAQLAVDSEVGLDLGVQSPEELAGVQTGSQPDSDQETRKNARPLK
ncbi:predicted protein [Chaetomium globosum CBS 148.51]|uniref:Uncharacterized protein n=1 Tax=Chaetomium globosum (strain ATCC 6205 / CBS 148.51 / DSM 1962 / NBRC 6347 / NRRL 1970) TaxID=306901 RepID=Q2GZC2_CHAGB|nr:uncharacterized protein CHGG_05124 [Chaetomium globosum CBS 148.51]EAQ88505.1 predicted protein [Chaetomium globosum CBS 148.51]